MSNITIDRITNAHLTTDVLFAAVGLLPAYGWTTEMYRNTYADLSKRGPVHTVMFDPNAKRMTLNYIGGTGNGLVKTCNTVQELVQWMTAPRMVAPSVRGYQAVFDNRYGYHFGCVELTWGGHEQLRTWVASVRDAAPAVKEPLGKLATRKRWDLNVSVALMYAIDTYLREAGWESRLGESMESIRATALKVAHMGVVHISLHPGDERLAFRHHDASVDAITVHSLRHFIEMIDGESAAVSQAGLIAGQNGNTVKVNLLPSQGGFSVNGSYPVTWAEYDAVVKWADAIRPTDV